LRLKKFVTSIKKYIGAYLALLGGAQAIVFSGDLGVESAEIRKRICDDDFLFLGIKVDDKKNCASEKEKIISPRTSKVKIFVIPSHEELIIGRETARVIIQEGIE